MSNITLILCAITPIPSICNMLTIHTMLTMHIIYNLININGHINITLIIQAIIKILKIINSVFIMLMEICIGNKDHGKEHTVNDLFRMNYYKLFFK